FGLPVISRVIGFTEVRSPNGKGVREVHPNQLEIPLGRMIAEAQLSTRVAQKQLQGDIVPLQRYNTRVEEVNGRVVQVLHTITGQEYDEQGRYDHWREWWTDQQGYAYQSSSTGPKPTLTQDVTLAYQPQTRPYLQTSPSIVGYRRHSCFGAGTPVL